MRIGIITWFHYENYGTALQAFALQYFLKINGYSCDLINYIPTNKDEKKEFHMKNIKEKIIEKLQYTSLKRMESKHKEELNVKSRLFKEFINNNCCLTEEIKSKEMLKDLNRIYDIFICGSDQIWNPYAFDETYFLNFVKNDKKKIAYAPSFGVTQVQDEMKQAICKLIERFDYLSTREEQGKEIIKTLAGLTSNVVLDPTLLLTDEQWNKVAVDPQINDKYILCYFWGNKKWYWEKVHILSKALNFKVVIIPIKAQSYKEKAKVLTSVGPKEFLGLIKNASYILTDSFHSTIFSINYGKNYFVFKRFNDNEAQSQNSRIINILKMMNMEDRIIGEKDNILKVNISIDNYYEIKNHLEILKQKSIRYLLEAIEGDR